MNAQAPPTLMLLPGLHGTDELFAPLLEQLPASLPTLRVNYPADAAMACEAYVDFVRQRLPADRSVVLLGESFSGPIAYRVAQQERSTVRGVVLAASFVSEPHPFLMRLTEYLPLGWITATRPARFMARRRLLNADPPAEVEAMLKTVMDRADPEVMAHRLRCIRRVGRPDETLDVPCCCIRATRDRVVPARSIREVRRAFGDVRVVDIDGPHLILQTRPRAAAEAILAFLDSLGAR